MPVSYSHGSAEFDSLVYWGPGDFAGSFRFGAVSAGANIPLTDIGYGYSLGVGTFAGDGSKGTIVVDMSGGTVMSGNIAGGVYFGRLEALSGTGKKMAKVQLN